MAATQINVHVHLFIDDKGLPAVEWRVRLVLAFARLMSVPLRSTAETETIRGNDPEGSSPRPSNTPIGRRVTGGILS